MKKAIAILLTLIMALSCTMICSSAARPPQLYADIDDDYAITILDATLIQMHLVGTYKINEHNIEAADVDADAEISILDATTIQMYLAETITSFPAGTHYNIDGYFYSVTPNYLSGKAYPGVEVEFDVKGYTYPSPSTTYFFVNGTCVETKQGSNPTFTFTFDKVGKYNIYVSMQDKWGENAGNWSCVYEVVEKPENTDTPEIVTIKRDWEYTTNPEFTVNVLYGTAPYEYDYVITDYDGNVVFELLDSDSNIFKVTEGLEYFCEYTLTVAVTDALGATTSATHKFVTKMLAPA